MRRPQAFQLGRSVVNVTAQAERFQRYIRVLRATVALGVVLVIGTLGYFTLTEGRYSAMRCLYMTVVTVSTVGYEEVIPTAGSDLLMGFTMGLILFGGGALLYFISSVTAIIIEGDLLHNVWRTRMRRRLDALHDHVILVGVGQTGRRALAELVHANVSVVVIEHDPTRLERVLEEHGERLPFIIGDGQDEGVLTVARIDRAGGLIAALPDDRENLYQVVTARQLNPRMRIVSKVESPANAPKLREGGADTLVNTASLGGTRLVNMLRHPELMVFNDSILGTESHGLSLAPVSIGASSPLAGLQLAEASLQDRTGCLVMGLRDTGEGPFVYHPDPHRSLTAGGAVMALGSRAQLQSLRELLA